MEKVLSFLLSRKEIIFPCHYISMFLAKTYLLATGWRPLSKKVQIFNRSTAKKAVLVFPHSSLWDFWLVLIYGLAFPELLENVNIVLRPQEFLKWYTPYLRYMNFIPATSLEKSGQGFVEHVSSFMLKQKNTYLLLSPKGQRKSGKWRSGYFHIAQKVNCPVIVVGLDYVDRCLKVGPIRPIHPNRTELETSLLQDMSGIIPLHMNEPNVPYLYKDQTKTVFSIISLCLFIASILFSIEVLIRKPVYLEMWKILHLIYLNLFNYDPSELKGCLGTIFLVIYFTISTFQISFIPYFITYFTFTQMTFRHLTDLPKNSTQVYNKEYLKWQLVSGFLVFLSGFVFIEGFK